MILFSTKFLPECSGIAVYAVYHSRLHCQRNAYFIAPDDTHRDVNFTYNNYIDFLLWMAKMHNL